MSRPAAFAARCMLGASLAVTAAAPSAPPADPAEGARALVSALMERWSDVYDNTEQVIFDLRGLSPLSFDDERRVRTIVAPIALPWLGADVLYVEEFLQDDPDHPRRQVLLRLEAERSGGMPVVRARQFTFRDPTRWRRLYESAQLSAGLSAQDVETIPGCDLILVREDGQFHGGTRGRGCVETQGDPESYVEYRLLLGENIYWYRKRLLRLEDGELLTDVVGYEWFELHRARLFACRIRWSRSGRPEDFAPLARVNLHDQGGRARFSTPDGRNFELELHSRDWPFDVNRDALILVLRELAAGAPLASTWTDSDSDQVRVEFEALDVRCGPLGSHTQDGARS
jgi:hypothetical protein